MNRIEPLSSLWTVAVVTIGLGAPTYSANQRHGVGRSAAIHESARSSPARIAGSQIARTIPHSPVKADRDIRSAERRGEN